ncbi:MAG: hypothetical protein SGI74_10620 [Oligoflexia bacterium]|nr:hypothetical protein [Oligoflexia bacterium]
MEFCVACETDSVVFGKTKIKVGRETFKTEAEHCRKCKKVAISPKLQKEIDEWALQFTKSIVELQPYFTEGMADKIEFFSNKYNLSKSEFMKVCTTFYILEMTKIKNFKSLRTEVLAEAKKKYKGERKKICVPIKYQLFKRIDLYARAWALEYESNVMEEAAQFCVTVLDSHVTKIEESKKQELVHFVENHAMAS